MVVSFLLGIFITELQQYFTTVLVHKQENTNIIIQNKYVKNLRFFRNIIQIIKKPSQKTLLNWEGNTHSVLVIYPTPKASQNEKTLNYHFLLDMFLLLQYQIEIQKVYR